MGTTRNKEKTDSAKKRVKRRGSGPIAFFVAFLIVVVGAIQLVSSIYNYAMNLSELNGLKRQEAALSAKKQDLENDISRWNDNAYVTAQARERLGFVFPGEQAIHVEHPEAVTGVKPKSDNTDQTDVNSDKQILPWYRELAYGFKKADEPLKKDKSQVTTPGAVSNQPRDAQNSGANDGQTNVNDNSKTGTGQQNKPGQNTGTGNQNGGNGKSGTKTVKR
ncbi:septum formation initiator family protein [Bifidobacterium sp. ESL0745]|uniref:FtsB family cell division protein n=1 Tax=Bifidobacterium sp. ESL0745 TaxID=2983226 RepID=UPI0023F83DE0|nr:septum formation initiator family protein [Bifidobacterium sp. ESL0745]MDF7665233.1 septum formation initiator family protein [Bifidobacterium sp. ESL0745]